MDPKDYIGVAGNPATQGLGRLVSQYVNSPNLKTLLAGILALANDLDLLFSRVQRIMNPLDDVTYDPGAAGIYPVNTQGAKTEQLKIIGYVVGVSNVVPGAGTTTAPQTLSDAHFLLLINAKIYRNFVKGCTIPQLLHSLQLIMPDRTGAGDIVITEIGFMTTMVMVNRAVADWEAGICAIPAGHSPIRGGILPRPTGTSLLTWWWDADSWTFATEADLTVLVDPTGSGFNTSESFTTGIGHWPQDF
jgi:hypothetical protein